MKYPMRCFMAVFFHKQEVFLDFLFTKNLSENARQENQSFSAFNSFAAASRLSRIEIA